MDVLAPVEGDELAVELTKGRERRKLRQQFRHVPPTPADCAYAVIGVEQTPEPIPLDLLAVVAAVGIGPERRSIGCGNGAAEATDLGRYISPHWPADWPTTAFLVVSATSK